MSARLRVLYLVNIPSPYRVAFFKEMGKYCELTVLFERRASDERALNWHDYRHENFTAVYLKGIRVASNNAFCPGVLSYLSRHKYDRIVVGGYSTPTGALAIAYLRLKGIPFVLNIDGGMVKQNESRRNYLFKRAFISSAKAWLSTGAVGSNYLRHYGAKEDKIYVYPFGSVHKADLLPGPMSVEDKVLLRKKLGINSGYMVVAVGQFIHRKGFDVLLEASSALTGNVTVCIIGGTPTPEYEAIVAGNGLKRVRFVGHLNKAELADYYRAADVFVLPTREDIWGLVVNEAMAYGLPVITTDKCVAGLELVDEGKNGHIVPVGDVQTLALRVNEILGSRDRLVNMSHASLATAADYTIERMATQTLDILKSLKGDGWHG